MSNDSLRVLCEAIMNDNAEAVTLALETLAGDPLSGPLTLAVRTARTGLLRVLIAAGADVNGWSQGKTPLHFAAIIQEWQAEHAQVPAMIEVLLAAGADPTAAATEEPMGTPFSYAATWGSIDALRLLSADERTRRAEHLAAALDGAANGEGAVAKVLLLLEKGADPNGRFALIRACESEVHREAALRLLAAGARADVADARGCTPLHCAVMAGTEEVVEALLARGAASDVATTRAMRDLDIRANETPRDLAVRRARLTQLQAVETILRELRVPVGEVGRFCARTAPNEDGAWEAAAAYAESVGDRSAANRAREPNCREDIDTSKAMPHLRSAARLLERLGVDLKELIKPVFRPGTWTLRRVENESGPIGSLKRWLRGKPPYTLEIDENGSFHGTLRRRKLHGSWKMTEHKLVLEDQKLGALDSVLDHEGISIVEQNNDDEMTFTRYVFAPR